MRLKFDFYRDINPVEGWLSEVEAYFLYNTARKIPKSDSIVEIGSWKGRSIICLVKGARSGYRADVYSIDPHTGSKEHHKAFGKVNTFEEFKRNLKKAGVLAYVKTLHMSSEKASKDFNRSIGFLYIDGDHSLRSVSLDFQLWFPKINVGGIVAFHDSRHLLGPYSVSAITLLLSSQARNPGLVDGITYFERTRHNTIRDRLNNIMFISQRLLLGIRGVFLRTLN